MKRYKKALIALGAALAVTGAALSDGAISSTELLQIGAAFLGSLGVYQAKNKE